MSIIVFEGQFTADNTGATGLTVTVDARKMLRSSGVWSDYALGAACQENVHGLYSYRITDADLSLYDYTVVFITEDAADLQKVPAKWVRWSEGGPDPDDIRDAIGMAAANLDTQLAGLAGDTGTGAWSVTLTIDDGTDPLESAKVRVTKGALSYLARTDANGVANLPSVFSLDDGTWTVAVTLPGYAFVQTTLMVSGANVTRTFSMTALAITPSAPGQTTGWLLCYDSAGNVDADVAVHCKIVKVTGNGLALDSADRTPVGTSGDDGLIQFSGLFLGASYQFSRGDSDNFIVLKIPVDADATYELPSFIGTP